MVHRGDAHAGTAGRERLTSGARRLLCLLGLLCSVGFASSAAAKVSVTKNKAVFAALSGTECVTTLADKGSARVCDRDVARRSASPAGLLLEGARATRSREECYYLLTLDDQLRPSATIS
ncbi:hypothetical protein T492DRAFT_1088478 [Pavlovales sp. CCMP2436]|nr:hypothetical protein T492DRAFT_1088478 [Pavlovales sp. CCMP2436]|mmetsp:Transcript_2006/g.5008  ORF Transcript_2006/g.5008 Transcript_2006/m.5008 type:complete len:120 (-) Transcript_2006:175-534(-)